MVAYFCLSSVVSLLACLVLWVLLMGLGVSSLFGPIRFVVFCLLQSVSVVLSLFSCCSVGSWYIYSWGPKEPQPMPVKHTEKKKRTCIRNMT